MNDTKANTVSSDCPSFYKEKVKVSQKGSKMGTMIKKFFAHLKGQK